MPPVDEPSSGIDVELTERPSRARRRTPLMVGLAIVVVLAVAGGVFLLLRNGDDDGISTGDVYRGSETDRVLLAEVEQGRAPDEVSWTTWGSDERPTEISEGRFIPAGVLAALGVARGDVAQSGGPLIGVAVVDDEEVVVAEVDGEIVELLDGGDGYDTYYHPPSRNVFVVESRDQRQRCYVGQIDEQLRRVARGDRCRFSDNGKYVLISDVGDDGEVEFEVVDIEGARVLRDDSVREPVFTSAGDSLIVFDGSTDRYSAVVFEIETGEVIAESARGSEVRLLGLNAAGSLLIASENDGGEALLELLESDGTVTELVTNVGSIAADFVREDRSEVLVVATTEGGMAASLVSPGVGGAEVEEVVFARGDQLVARTASPGQRAGRFVVAERNDDDSDGVLYVRARTGMTEIDVDDFIGVIQVTASADAGYLYLVLESGESFASRSLLVVDLATGEVTWLVEDWQGLRVVDVHPNGAAVAVVGYEDEDDSDQVVAHVTVDGVVEVADEGPEISGVRYTDDGESIVLSVFDGDLDTYVYAVGSRTQPDLVFRDLIVYRAGWDASDVPVRYSSPAVLEVRIPGQFCDEFLPGFDRLDVGGSVSGTIGSSDRQSYCLQVANAADASIVVSSDFDSFLEVYGPYSSDGGSVGSYSNDDANGVDAELMIPLMPGAYEVVVSGFGGTGGTYTLTVR